MPGEAVASLSGTIMLIFYLYLLARWQYVKRPILFLLGAAGLVFGMIGGFFGSGETGATVARIFGVIGVIVAFVAAVGACFGGELPVKLPGGLTQTTSQAPQQPPPSAK